MSKLRIGLRTGAALALAVLVMIPVSYELVQKRMFEQGTDGTKPAFTLPLGAQTYSIAQAAEVWPKIREARIDPPDVHVGDVQTIEVVVQSHGAIQEVYADVETDTDTVRVPLSYVEDVAGDLRDPIAELTGQGVAQKASADDTVQRRYRGQWTVRDTHDTTYHTTIVAKGDEGTSSVVMAWSDVCSIPPGGDFTLGGPCTISADDGIDDGNFTVSGSMTINANFAVNSGKQIIISGGSIALCEGCTITQTNIWQVDSDGDGFPADSVMTLADDVGFGIGGLRRRYLLEAEQDYDDNTYDPTNSGGAAAAVRVAY